jgi:hypothetical protein
MNDDGLDALRAAVDRHEGPARAQPLMALGQALAQRYWQVGPGSPAAEPYLDEAIRVLDEAYGHLEPGQFPRGMQASMLGWLHGIRHAAHGGPVADRERGINLLDEALGFPQLPQMLQLLARMILGQLLLSRVTTSMRSGDFMMRALRSGLSGEEKASADRAVACFREILDAPAASAELTTLARTMLGLAEALQSFAGGLGGGLAAGPGGLDLGRLMQSFAGLQNLMQQAGAPSPGTGFGRIPSPFDLAADDLAALPPRERPVTVIEGAVPPAAAAPAEPVVHSRPAEPRTPAATFRAAFLELLPGSGVAALLELLDRGADAGVETVDELAALAGSLVDAPGAVGTDRLLLAVALYLRHAVDPGGGWGDGDADDLRDARESLLDAAEAVAGERADTVAVAHRLATLLDEQQPARGVRSRLAERFAGVAKALRAVGAGGLLYQGAGQSLLLSADTGSLAPVRPPSPSRSRTPTCSSLPGRVLVVGDAPVTDGSTVSYVRSGAQVIELAGRARRPLGEAVVFVANPRGDRQQASMDALLLRRTFYPRSTGLGRTVEHVDGDGTPDEVVARLDASLLHLGCGITPDGALELAGPDVLGTARIAAGPPATAGGLAVLPSTEGAAALTDALLASRFAGVIGFREAIPDDVASLIHLLLHSRLVDAGSDPASAVEEVRRWLADPDRTPPEFLPPWSVARASEPDLARYRDALMHHGV